MQMKKFLVLAFFASVSLLTVHAQRSGQTDYKPAPYMFVGVQGGAQTTIANYDQLKLLTPTASVSFGAFFTPTVGARLHVNGMWDKGGIEPDFEYKYKYATADVDLLLNLCTLFGKKDYYPLNVYLIGGVGLNYAWDNDELMGSSFKTDVAWKDHQLSHNARVGLMFGANISKHWSANLEVNMNFIDDRFNSLSNDKDDRMLTAQVGLAYKFGFKKISAPTTIPTPKPVVAESAPAAAPAAAAAAPAPKKEPQPAVRQVDIQKEIFFALRETTVSDGERSKIEDLVKFLKENPDKTIVVTGYADSETGNSRINMTYAQQRAENVARALKESGIDAARIIVDAKGDSVQPFGENDKNRVVIAISK